MNTSASQQKGFSKEEVKVLGLSSLGGMLEFYDFIIFVFFASFISKLFFPANLGDFWSLLNTYGAFAAGYLARPLGGIIMAHFGDKKGRKNMFMLSIVLMVVPTFALGLMPTFETIGYLAPVLLICVRLMQGISIGGELPGAWVFMSEHAKRQNLYFSVGILTSAVVGGILLGSIVALVVKQTFNDETILAWAWRVPFIIGGVFGVISIYLRRYLHETPVFQAMQNRGEIVKLPIKEVLKIMPDNFAAMLASWVLTGCIVVMILLMPNFMGGAFAKNGVEVGRLTTIYMQMACIVCMCVGCVLYGKFADKVGVARASILFAAVFVVAVFFYFYALFVAGGGFGVVCGFYLAAGFFGAVGPCGAPFYMTALYPNRIRFSAISFSYNIAYAIAGGFTPPFVVTMMTKSDPMNIAYYMVMLGFVSIAINLWFMRFRRDVNTEN